MNIKPKLDRKKRYLQVALNGTLDDAQAIIRQLPVNERVIVEAGTPLIKRYGEAGIRKIRQWCDARFYGSGIVPYIVADMKAMDRGDTEVMIAKRGGASAAVVLGDAPIETINAFVDSCVANGLDAMIDMMNVDFPLGVLRQLKQVPPIVILHRGVDEETFNRDKEIPLYEIRRIKGSYDVMISIAGGDTIREVQSSVFNDCDIVVIWKSVYDRASEIGLVADFLKVIE